MVQILYEDGRDNTRFHEKLVAMKQEKEGILERMHEMEMQLHQDQEALTKHMLEAKVNHSNLSSNSSTNRCVGSFQKHNRGIGSRLMLKMGFEGKGLGKHSQGMIDPILVEERPKRFGLGYVQSNGENPKP